jgi:iron complex transport system ATP-binding protein
MTRLMIHDLTVHRGTCPVVDRVSFAAGPGECIGLIGPNGAGKTTLMRAILGLQAATGDSTLADMRPVARARSAAWMPQARDIAWPVPVAALVALGRLPHLPRGARLASADQAAVDHALDQMDLTALRNRPATELSGGEQARVLIARALAQDTDILIADEPTAGLDPAHQIAAMRVFADLARAGRIVLVSLHDLGLAARHCTRLLLLDRGRLVADGPPETVLSANHMARTFGITAYFRETPEGPVFQPMEVLA